MEKQRAVLKMKKKAKQRLFTSSNRDPVSQGFVVDHEKRTNKPPIAALSMWSQKIVSASSVIL